MRALGAAAITACVALGGCGTTSVALLDAEPGSPVGSVAVLNPKDEAERGVLTAANTRSTAGGRVNARPVDAARYADLTNTLPAPPARWVLYFPEGSTELTPDSAREFQMVLAEVARRPGAEVQITGHSDRIDSQAVNDELSKKRAQEIAAALQKHGLDLDITRVTGRGERELLVPTADNVAEPRNRRVEITVR